MKKTKILSVFLAAVMLLSLIPAVGLTASAAESALPATLPGDPDSIYRAGFYGGDKSIHWNTSGGATDTAMGTLKGYEIIPEKYWGRSFDVIKGSFTPATATHGADATKITFGSSITIPANAVGFLVHLETTSTATTTGFNFVPSITGGSGLRKENIANTVKSDAPDMDGNGTIDWWDYTGYQAYYYDETNGCWRAEIGGGDTVRMPNGFSGWYYIPFESFNKEEGYFAGKAFTGAEIKAMRDDDTTKKITVNSIAIATMPPMTLPDLSGTGLVMSGWHYTANDAACFSHYNPKNSCQGVHYLADDCNGYLTNGLTNGTVVLPIETQGRKFSLQSVYDGTITTPNTDVNDTYVTQSITPGMAVPANATGFMLQLTMDGKNNNTGLRFNPTFDFDDSAETCRTTKGGGAYAYYFDSNSNVWRATACESYFRLPDQFSGYVYIPFETWQITKSASYQSFVTDPHLTIEDLEGHSLTKIEFCNVQYKTHNIVISDVSFVLLDTIAEASLTVDDSLDLNVYAYPADANVTPKLTVTPKDEKLAEKYPAVTLTNLGKQSDGSYKFTYENILPQFMTEEFLLELKDASDNVLATETFSIRNYCEALLKDGTHTGPLYMMAADILRYGAAAQTYANYKTDDLATKGLENLVGRYASSTDRTDISGTVYDLTSAVSGAKFVSTRFVLEETLVWCLKIEATSAFSVKVGNTTINSTDAAVEKNGNFYTLKFAGEGISATSYSDTLTAVLTVGGKTQTLTYSVNDYLSRVNDATFAPLANALYAYGLSADNYGKTNISVPSFTTTNGTMQGGEEAYNCGQGVSQVSYTGVQATERTAFIEQLEKAGFVATAKEIKDGNNNIFNSYAKGTVGVHLSWYPTYNSGTFKIVTDVYGWEPSRENEITDDEQKIKTPSIAQLKRLAVEYSTSAPSPGMQYVIQLSDGRFVLVDSGPENETDRATLLKYLQDNKPTAHNKPIIAGWFFTHAHGDHMGLADDFLKYSGDQIELQAVFYNIPALGESGFECSEEPVATWMIPHYTSFLEQVEQHFPNIPRYKFQTGETFWLGDAQIDILFTHQDYYPNPFVYGNDTSSAFRITLGGKSMIFLGDCEAIAAQEMTEMYGSALDCDIMQVPHHGGKAGDEGDEKVFGNASNSFDSPMIAFYEKLNPSICLWPIDESRFNNDHMAFAYSKWLVDNIKTNDHASETKVITLQTES